MWVTATFGYVGLGIALICNVAPLRGQATGAGAPMHAVLVELFTSEGCSSCPPADALLRAIDGKRTEAGQLVVGISEHVTYWNRLGWADPFSSEVYTARQDGYRSHFRLDSAYTPQVVVNGEREVLGSDRGAVLAAVKETDHASPIAVHIVSAKVSADSLLVTYLTTGDAARGGAELFAVVTDDMRTSQVARGENSGRSLSHVSVARSMTRVGEVRSSAGATVQLPLGRQDKMAGGRHVILFAQAAGLGRVLAIDSAPIQRLEDSK